MKEDIYVLFRRIKAFCVSLCFYLCRIFPIDSELISVCTFEGKGGFGCNPKYIVKELHQRNCGFKFVWFVNDMDRLFPDYIHKVPNTVWSRAFWLSRSKIWIDNYRKPYGTKKRKGQFYLNVNHFTLALKGTGLLRGNGFSRMAYLVNKNDSDMIDALVIDSKWCEECFDKAMVYNGSFLKTGAPRCDILFGDKSLYRESFRSRHKLPDNAMVVMFAPTFREGSENGRRFVFSEEWSLDFGRLIKTLETKFGGKWYICIRVHPQLCDVVGNYHNESIQERLIDESRYDDMYELLAGMDAFITDYSSAVFEAGFAHIPAFLYADDIEEYNSFRGNMLWNLGVDERKHITNNKEFLPALDLILPFSLAENNDQLEEDILCFDRALYNKKLDLLHEKIELLFDGQASCRIADRIEFWEKR